MVKMRALRQFSHTVYGNVGAGDVFECDDGYALQFIGYGLAVRVAPHSQPVPAAPSKDWSINMAQKEGDAEIGAGVLATDPVVPELSRTITSEQKPRRGRRRK